MKQYRVSLDVATSPTLTGPELAGLLGVPPSALTRERRGRGVLWRYEPSTGQAGTIADRISQLASEVHPGRAVRDAGIERISLGLDVRYDTFTCQVILHLDCVASLAESVSELSSVELTCSPSGGEGTTPPAHASKLDTNIYIVSLDAITSAAATASEVADALGVPPDGLVTQRTQDGAVWTCEVEADRTVGLAEQMGLLVAAAHPRQPLRPGGGIRALFLDLGVIYDVNKTDTCAVSLPMPLLRSLAGKLPVGYVRVRCYPGTGEEGSV